MNFVVDVFSFLTQNLNPTGLDRKLETALERDYVKIIWDTCVQHKLSKFIYLKENFIDLYQPHITYHKKINDELPIQQSREILSKTDKGKVPKQLNFFELGQNIEFENRVKSSGLSTNSIHFLVFLQSNFCQEILIQNKLKIHIETGNIFFNNLDTNESNYNFFQKQEK